MLRHQRLLTTGQFWRQDKYLCGHLVQHSMAHVILSFPHLEHLHFFMVFAVCAFPDIFSPTPSKAAATNKTI